MNSAGADQGVDHTTSSSRTRSDQRSDLIQCDENRRPRKGPALFEGIDVSRSGETARSICLGSFKRSGKCILQSRGRGIDGRVIPGRLLFRHGLWFALVE